MSTDDDPEAIQSDVEKKHRQWLNLPRLVLPIVEDLLQSGEK